MRRCLALLTALAACGPTAPASESGSSTAVDTTGLGTTAVDTTLTPTTSSTTTDPGLGSTSEAAPTTAAETGQQGFVFESDGGVCSGALGPDGKFRCLQCDLFDQDCKPGEKCTAFDGDNVDTWNAHKCVPVTGDGLVGDPCTTEGDRFSGIDDCALGHFCWNHDEQLKGTCVALCTGHMAEPECADEGICLFQPGDQLALCFAACNPLLQDCPAGDTCIAAGPGFACVADVSGDEGQATGPCDSPGGCDPGLICVDHDLVSSACTDIFNCCTPFCSFPDDPCPNPDQTCKQWFEPGTAPPGLENLGVCGT